MKVFTFAGLLIPIVLAGYRDYSVGTDTLGYFHYSIWNNFSEIDIFGRREPFFQIASFFANRYKYFNIVLIAYQTASVVFLYAACCRLQKMLKPNGIVLSIPFVFFLYYCIDFNMSLNIMRQGTAVIYFIFAVTFLLERKYLTYCILIILGYAFHSTILLTGALALVAFLLASVKSRYRTLMTLGYFVIMMIMGVAIGQLLQVVTPILGEGWTKTAEYYSTQNRQVSIILFVATTYMTVLYILCRSHNSLPKPILRFILLMIIAEFAFQLSGLVNAALVRFALYFTVFYSVSTPLLIEGVRRPTVEKFIYSTTAIGIFFFYWYWIFIRSNSGQTADYSSLLLLQWIR